MYLGIPASTQGFSVRYCGRRQSQGTALFPARLLFKQRRKAFQSTQDCTSSSLGSHPGASIWSSTALRGLRSGQQEGAAWSRRWVGPAKGGEEQSPSGAWSPASSLDLCRPQWERASDLGLGVAGHAARPCVGPWGRQRLLKPGIQPGRGRSPGIQNSVCLSPEFPYSPTLG